VFRSRRLRAGLFLLIVTALLVSGAGHAVFHGDRAHEGHADAQDGGDCVACSLRLTDDAPSLTIPSAPLRAVRVVELGPESLPAALERGRATPRGPPFLG